ncbi:MAG: SDR family NAD(P)-dependent oxidoreductase [Spirochaetia bacterium]|jgi:3-oxoacyl-[acyl-carrier protein] reductase
MSGLLEKKVAVVTGAGRGIGEAISLKLAENGATVVIADIDLGNASAVAEKIHSSGGKGEAVRLDVAEVSGIRGWCDAIVKRLGRIDIWVNNAGISQDIPIEDLGEKDWDRLMGVDLKGAFFCSQAAYRIMKEQKSGKIINIGSVAGERGGLFAGAHYSAAKAGLIVLAKCFALNGGKYNINSNAIAPGLIHTQMAEELGIMRSDPKSIPLQRFGTPLDVANTVLYLASSLSDYVTGLTVDVNGGLFMR